MTAPLFPIDPTSLNLAPAWEIRSHFVIVATLIVCFSYVRGNIAYTRAAVLRSCQRKRTLGYQRRPSDNVNSETQARWPPRFLETELRATSGEGFVSHLKKGLFIPLQSAIQWYLHKFGKSAGGYDAPVYL